MSAMSTKNDPDLKACLVVLKLPTYELVGGIACGAPKLAIFTSPLSKNPICLNLQYQHMCAIINCILHTFFAQLNIL